MFNFETVAHVVDDTTLAVWHFYFYFFCLFLFYNLLVHFKSRDHIVHLITFCVTSTSLSLIWNGVRFGSFSPNRGLRQRDPFSPYLFVLCMEKLSLMILEKVEKGHWKPEAVTSGGDGVSHPFFAGDILLFAKAKASQMTTIMQVLHDFHEVSSLHVNVAKSKVMCFKAVPRTKRNKLAVISSIPFADNLGKYFGLIWSMVGLRSLILMIS